MRARDAEVRHFTMVKEKSDAETSHYVTKKCVTTDALCCKEI